MDSSIKAVKITHVAVKTPTEIWSMPKPNRHHDVLRLMSHHEVHAYGNEIQGFLDENGKFLDRKTAYVLACTTGQIDRSWHPPNSYDGNELYSEDLW